jgi:hypothetical protein
VSHVTGAMPEFHFVLATELMTGQLLRFESQRHALWQPFETQNSSLHFTQITLQANSVFTHIARVGLHKLYYTRESRDIHGSDCSCVHITMHGIQNKQDLEMEMLTSSPLR